MKPPKNPNDVSSEHTIVYRRYDWSSLEVGDSFVVDGHKERLRVRTSFIRFQKSNPDHFPPRTVLSSRAIGDDQYLFWLLQIQTPIKTQSNV